MLLMWISSWFQQNMDIYRRSKLSEQELEALELREREVSVEMSRWVANGKPAQVICWALLILTHVTWDNLCKPTPSWVKVQSCPVTWREVSQIPQLLLSRARSFHLQLRAARLGPETFEWLIQQMLGLGSSYCGVGSDGLQGHVFEVLLSVMLVKLFFSRLQWTALYNSRHLAYFHSSKINKTVFKTVLNLVISCRWNTETEQLRGGRSTASQSPLSRSARRSMMLAQCMYPKAPQQFLWYCTMSSLVNLTLLSAVITSSPPKMALTTVT